MEKSSKTTVICLVPVKNESWVLKNFLECASKWADVIIMLNHNSTDTSVQIAQQYERVKIIHHNTSSFDEGSRRNLLWDEARKIPGKRLIFSIDADEMISANWGESPDWEMMLNAPPGTRFRFDWLEVQPGIEHAAVFDQVAAFIDDGTEFQFGNVNIHTPRIPVTGTEVEHLKDIKLLHFLQIDPDRMFSKHRYLKCFEYLENGRRPWSVCIMYQDNQIKNYYAPIIPLDVKWVHGYDWLNQYRSTDEKKVPYYWYDLEVFNYFDRYGVKKFRKLNIWDIDWQRKAKLLGRTGEYSDPRSRYEKLIHDFIVSHREELKIRQTVFYKAIRLFGKTVLRVFGW